MKISLSPEIESMIEARLKSGRFSSADDVVRRGLELLEKTENPNQSASTNGDDDLVASFQRIAAEMPKSEWESFPTDFAANVDHYLYGSPKKS